MKRAQGGRRPRWPRPIGVAAFNVDPVLSNSSACGCPHRDKIQGVWTLSVRAKTVDVYERIRIAEVPGDAIYGKQASRCRGLEIAGRKGAICRAPYLRPQARS